VKEYVFSGEKDEDPNLYLIMSDALCGTFKIRIIWRFFFTQAFFWIFLMGV
jgi:hypothetical protein